jgi:hypothetical protein
MFSFSANRVCHFAKGNEQGPEIFRTIFIFLGIAPYSAEKQRKMQNRECKMPNEEDDC